MPVPTIDELTDFIEDPLRAKLNANRKIRRKNRRKNALLMAVVVLIFLPVAIGATIWHGSYGNEFLGGATSSTVPILLALVFAFLYMPLRLRYSSEEIPFEYTPDVVAPLIHFIDPRLSYSSDRGIEGDEFAQAGVLDERVEGFDSRHLFAGRLRDVELRLAYVEARAKGKGVFRRQGGEKFRGLFAVARFAENVGAATVVIPRRTSPSSDPLEFGHTVVASQDEGLDSVQLGDHEFDSRFELRSTGEGVLSRWFTEPVVERLVALHDAFCDDQTSPAPPFVLLACDDRLYFACRQEDYFERSAPRHSLDTTHLHRRGRQIRALVDVVEFTAMALRADRH